MGFWDDYVDEGGGGYVSADEKAALIDNAVAIQILSVREDDENQFQGKLSPRFVTTVNIPNPLTGEDEERILPFGKVAGGSSRDRMLSALIEYMDEDGSEDVFVVLEKIGNFIAVRKA
jgi:hypothetical protein